MKCPKCIGEEFSLTHYEKPQRGRYTKKERAILECKKCGHKEVFGK
mgnify:FL=1